MARATRDHVVELLEGAGTTLLGAVQIVDLLADAELSPSPMRTWLDGPARCYSVPISPRWWSGRIDPVALSKQDFHKVNW